MEKLVLFFTNSWTVSIITGIVVFFITDFIKRGREKKEYHTDIKQANIEVQKTLKMLIPENNLPEVKVIHSLYTSTANKYGVKISDMHELSDVFDDLIKDVIESSYLTYKDKLEYCNEINKVKELVADEEKKIKKSLEEPLEVKLYKAKFRGGRRNYSMIFPSFIAVFSSLLAMYIQIKEGDRFFDEFDNPEFSSLFTLMLIIMLFSVIIFALLQIKINLKKREHLRDLKKKFDEFYKDIS